jgi:cobyrinic acid a,c-diamide synthase
MVLGTRLVDRDGAGHEMAGLLPLATSFAAPRLHLGYRRLRLLAETPLGAVGDAFSGHEFHYSAALREGPGTPLFAVEDANGAPLGACGLVERRVAGAYIHLIDRVARSAA